ncbi:MULTISPECIES: hypothetical protein [unclassified Nitratiruptor]|uniref:hypothetical protein n=1 Tax=unclassified Nitratiruptor TaxID=2624044 RepID=UPI00191580E9|nr:MULTISPECIES: hypothetical protein [unclassified Nitratiruptor]BCD59419.1 hypothetical protein NitYY0810_C0155 [Nitratiruptor sp. YY08-10]BCD63343.1 hypothetical protein NitYY0814_C0155 [Nitratiruptor sp. YY08-14]
MRYKLLLGLLPLLFLGCESRVYKKIYAYPSIPITCLKLKASNPIVAYALQKRIDFQNSCPFILKTTSHFVATCSSAKAKALGSDFDGFLRLELFENNKLLYRDQVDFKGCITQKIVDTLLQSLQKDMKLSIDIRYNPKK